MPHRPLGAVSSVIALLLVCSQQAHPAKLNLRGKTFDQVVEEAKRTGVVDRALRGILLLRTVRGKLTVQTEDGAVTGATLQATAREDYDFLQDEKYRCAIMKKRWEPVNEVYTIPNAAQHFFLVRPDMDGKRVEAQFQLVAPTELTVAGVRFVEVYRGQGEAPPLTAAARPVPVTPGRGKTYYVSPTGADDNPGTRERPFQHIARGLSTLKPGDTLLLRGGTYREPLVLTGLRGTAPLPLTIAGAPGERAVIDGSESLDRLAAGPWTRQGDGNVWQRPMRTDVLQLWRDGRSLMLAHWPKLTKNWTEDMAPEFNGRLPEPGTAWHVGSYFARFDAQQARANFAHRQLKALHQSDYPFHPTPFDAQANLRKLAFECRGPLAATGRSFEGATVEGLGPAALVTHHEAGSNRLEVVLSNSESESVSDIALGRFALVNHLSCLDQENEWVFDSLTRTLSVRLPPGDSPDRHDYRARPALRVSRLRNCEQVHLCDLDFFACALEARDSPGTVVEGCVFSYPTCRPLTLVARTMVQATPAAAPGRDRAARKAARVARKQGGEPTPEETTAANGELATVSSAVYLAPGGVLRDCEICYYDSSGVELEGADSLLENCYLHHGTRYGVIFTRSPGAVARRNTLHSTLTQGALRIRKTPQGRFTSELNYGYDLGAWRSDASGTQVQSGSQIFHMFRYNWFHHSECKAARFDGQPAGSLGTFVGNVGWRLWQGLQIKGDYQKVYNNTFFSCGARHDISVINQMAFGGGQHCLTRNNLCDRISGHRQIEDLEGEGKIPGVHDHNWNGLVTKRPSKSLLRDPDNFDFRPRNDPEVVDAGTTVVEERFVPGSWLGNLLFVKAEGNTTRQNVSALAASAGDPRNAHTHRFLGNAPDLGAYEYGDRYYWIPGRQLRRASFPIPPDNARYVKTDADLMWLEGKQAVAHHVFLGTDRARVARADLGAGEYVGRFTDSNLCTPPNGLQKDTRYYWRVDAVEAGGTVLKGDVWTFLPCDGQYREYQRIATPTGLKADLTGPRRVTLTWEAVADERLAGYNLYRRWGNPEYVTTAGRSLNIEPLTTLTFTDTTLDQPGKWCYVIEAVDDKGVASDESLPTEVRVP